MMLRIMCTMPLMMGMMLMKMSMILIMISQMLRIMPMLILIAMTPCCQMESGISTSVTVQDKWRKSQIVKERKCSSNKSN